MNETEGGRVYFSDAGRSLVGEDEIILSSVGVDIGSSTSHLVFSRLVLERLDNRYVVAERTVTHQSDVLLTPYAEGNTIDTEALGRFIAREYGKAGQDHDSIDTGALILTGIAVRRANARAIGELFAAQAGKFVSLSAGDALESTLAAYGSGAVALSIREITRVMNVDIGGGTTKIAVCDNGQISEITALDAGARVIALDKGGRVTRIEEAGRIFAEEAGASLKVGEKPQDGALEAIAARMADRIFEAMGGAPLSAKTKSLLRLDPLSGGLPPARLTFSGGVSEFIYGREKTNFGDLGAMLAAAVLEKIALWGPSIAPGAEGIRATVVGASQYTVQVSGSTIFVHPPETLPVRNIPVIAPELPLEEVIDPNRVGTAIAAALKRLDLTGTDQPVALCYRWRGSATFDRLDGFARGLAQGFAAKVPDKLPLVLVGDGDVGGLLGIHIAEELPSVAAIVSIDGVNLSELDFIDIGAILPASGAVPVVIKSLVFPSSGKTGRPVSSS